jgi:predicted Ser/Thr protein kinase
MFGILNRFFSLVANFSAEQSQRKKEKKKNLWVFKFTSGGKSSVHASNQGALDPRIFESPQYLEEIVILRHNPLP